MADCTINGDAIVSGALVLKRRGNWTLRARRIDAELPPTGVVSVVWLGRELVGNVLRSGKADGVCDAIIVGGKTEHSKRLGAANYDNQVTAYTILSAIARDQGEIISNTVSIELLRRTLPRFAMRAGTFGEQLDLLCDALGCVWRMLTNGQLWIGVDDYPRAAEFDHVVHPTFAPGTHRVPIDCYELGILPGETYTGPPGYEGEPFALRIATVHYTIEEGGPTAILYAVDARTDSESGAMQALREVMREEIRRHEYYKPHAGTVLLQRGDGTLDVELDDADLADITSAPIRSGVPGAKITVPAQSRCVVCFEDGSPDKYAVVSFADGSATRGVALNGGKCNAGTLTITAVANGVFVGTYTDPDGVVTPVSLGSPIALSAKIIEGSDRLALPS